MQAVESCHPKLILHVAALVRKFVEIVARNGNNMRWIMQIYLFLVVKTVYDILNSLIHFRLGFRFGPEQDVAVFRPDRLQFLHLTRCLVVHEG